jgi:hypothetical protein
MSLNTYNIGTIEAEIVWKLDWHLPIESVLITTSTYDYYSILLSLIFFYIDCGWYVFNATEQYFSYIVAVSLSLVAEHGRDNRGRNRMKVGLTSTYRISAYYHYQSLIKFVNDLWRQVSGFLWIHHVLQPNLNVNLIGDKRLRITQRTLQDCHNSLATFIT